MPIADPPPESDLLRDIQLNTYVPKWTRLCWWVSRKLGGRPVFGKRDES